MILEGFEIENWSCIKRVVVSDLPAAGVIVLHGPNGTGKSSMIEALRACLMDNKSTSKALDRGFPKNSNEKPRVSVTFRAGGTVWRITKQFGSKDSKLESRTLTGEWKLESADPSEAHERTRLLTGGSDSSLGLHQLLWLTQAEFRLPEPKKFDQDVQARLRSVLGVLQTPLDDRFLGRVKDRWAGWFGARSKPGEKPKLKKDCPLDKALAMLQRHEGDLAALEADYVKFERLLEQSAYLQVQARDLRQQLAEKTSACDAHQEEYEQSLQRLEAHRLAGERVAQAVKAQAEAQERQERRAGVERDIGDAEKAAVEAGREVDDRVSRLQGAEQRLRDSRREQQALRDMGREWQDRLNKVGDRQRWLALKGQWKSATENLQRADSVSGELEALKQQAREHPAPDAETMSGLDENRRKAAKLRAELGVAAIELTFAPDPGSAVARLTLDGAPAVEIGRSSDGAHLRHSVQRRAEFAITGWGSASITRGSQAGNLDQIENDLNELERAFAKGLEPFGIAAGDSTALDKLRALLAEKQVRAPAIKRKKEELDRLAPNGLDQLREEVAKLENRVHANEPVDPLLVTEKDLPLTASDLEQLGKGLAKQIEINDASLRVLQQQIDALELEIDGKSKKGALVTPGLRKLESEAMQALTTLNATVGVLRNQLDRMLTAEQIDQAIREVDQAADQARNDLGIATLSEGEATIADRLEAAKIGRRAIDEQLRAVNTEFDRTTGIISTTEGLHQKRAAAAARVEELSRQTARETLESEAYDRLCALFEECREKQLGAVMGPIHDRVVRWMRLLRIGGYQSIRFNDQFLPDKLVAGHGALELSLAEESTGTIEQIGLMVRLALGSTLSTPAEAVVAVLDDPLTHSDVVRLDLMRAVLKNASAGDPGATPPAGPLQILVFTCHPEWFTIDGAKVIDVAKAMA